MYLHLLRNEWIKITNDKELLLMLFLPILYPWYFIIMESFKSDTQLIAQVNVGLNNFENSYFLYFRKIYFVYTIVILPLTTTLISSSYGRFHFKSKELNILRTYPVSLTAITQTKIITLIILCFILGMVFFVGSQLAILTLFSLKPVLAKYIITFSIGKTFLMMFNLQILYCLLSIPALLFAYLISIKFRHALIINIILCIVLTLTGLLSNFFTKLSPYTLSYEYYTSSYKALIHMLKIDVSSNFQQSNNLFLITVIISCSLIFMIYRAILNHEDK